MPWNDDAQCLIDRFDGRALLDAMSVVPRGGLKIEENRDLEQNLNYERYRDVVEHKRELLSESDALQRVVREIDEQDFKLYNKTAPTHRELEKQKAKPKPQPVHQPGQGEFSTVGFNYDDETGEDVKRPAVKERPKREESAPEQEPETAPHKDAHSADLLKEVPRDKEREVNSTSRMYGIEDYARMVRLENTWLRDQHENKTRRGRKLRDRVRDLEPVSGEERRRSNPPWRRGEDSPTYDRYTPMWAEDQSDSRSRSNSPARESNIEFSDGIEISTETAPSSAVLELDVPLNESTPSARPLRKSDDRPLAAAQPVEIKQETPQEKLMRKMRHALDKTRRKDEEETRRKEAEKEEERRQREHLLEREARELEELQRTKEGEFDVQRWNRSHSRSRSRSPRRRSRSRSRSKSRSRSRSRTRRHRSRSRSRSRRRSRSRSRDRRRSRSRNRKRKSRSRSGSRDRKRQRRSPSPVTAPPAAPAKKMSKLDRLLFEAQEKEKKLLEEKKAKLDKARQLNRPSY